MTDLRDRFRSLDQLQAPDLWSEVRARASEADRVTAPPWVANRTLRLGLVMIALLLIMSIGLALGAAILRDDRDPDDPGAFALAGPIAHCDQTLPEGVSFWIRGLGAAQGWAEGTELTGYPDGLVVAGPTVEWGGSANSIYASWSQRRLSADGVALLVDSLTGSVPGCQSFGFDGGIAIRARTAAGVSSIGLGPDVLRTRIESAAQEATVADLLGRLADSDLGLAAENWADAQWTPYLPERLRITLEFWPTAERDYPSTDGIVLPDGSTLRTFGSDREDSQESSVGRCVIGDSEEATAIATILTDASGDQSDPPMSSWAFSDDEGYVLVSMVGLLPHDPNCPTDVPVTSPTPEPSASRAGPAPLADACDYAPSAAVIELIGLTGEIEHYPEWSADWAFCWQPVEGDGFVIAASRRSLPSDRAADQARSLFGDVGFSTEQIAGHNVFLNGCATTDSQCRSAVAISAEPHFVVLIWRAGSLAVLRQMAERVIQELDGAG